MPRINRSASDIDEEPPEKKAAVDPPKRKGVIRRSACAGCLILLANWLPEDGEPPWCYDFDIGALNGISFVEGTVERTCVQCSHHGKCCFSDDFLDEEGLDLHLALEYSLRDNAKIKRVQKSIRESLGISAKHFRPGNEQAAQTEEVKFRESSQSLGQAINKFGAFIEDSKREMRTEDNAGFRKRCKNGLGMGKFMFDKVQHCSSKRFASGTIEGMGFI